jgi:TrmH family RNA methyltransferase
VELSRIDVVLVRPARAANVAAACRAMKNMGLSGLRLVEPAVPVDEKTRRIAWRAGDVLERAQRHPDLASAVADAALVVGTSGEAEEAWTPRRLAGRAARRCGSGRLSVVFGPESSGLTRDEQLLCHVMVRIPTGVAQPSLNLAQAVLLIAYEMRLGAETREERRWAQPALAGELEQALASLRRGLLGIGYLNPQSPERLLGELRRLLARAGPSQREVALLRGLGRQIEWAAAQLGRSGEGQ